MGVGMCLFLCDWVVSCGRRERDETAAGTADAGVGVDPGGPCHVACAKSSVEANSQLQLRTGVVLVVRGSPCGRRLSFLYSVSRQSLSLDSLQPTNNHAMRITVDNLRTPLLRCTTPLLCST